MLPTSIRRVAKELQQIKNEPIEGVSLVQINKNNYTDFIVNLRIQQGPYKGSIAHCSLILNEKHPQIAPYMSIFIGCGFEESKHHHIFDNGDRVIFCIDILSNSIMNSTEIGSGWNPAYTIKTLLMQIQQFISDPDSTHPIHDCIIKNFQKSNYNYEREYQVDSLTVKHSFLQPYPPFEKDSLQFESNPIIELMKPTCQSLIQEDVSISISNSNEEQKSTDQSNNSADIYNDEKINEDSDLEDKDIKVQEDTIFEMEEQKTSLQFFDETFKLPNNNFIKEHLTCYMNLSNPIDDPDQIFGLPLYLEMDEFGRLQSHALTEILSYEGFQSILQSHGLQKMSYQRKPLKSYSNRSRAPHFYQSYPIFKSSQGNAFNCWLPLFINKQHFEKNIFIIEKSISELSKVEENFKPSMVLEIIPNLINKMFVKIFENKTSKISSVAIQTYIQLFQLLINFCEKYPSLQQTIDKKVIGFARNDSNRNKKVVGDLGEFFVNLAASSYSFNQFEFLDLLYREQSARQMKWLEKNEEFMIEFTSFPQPSPPYFDQCNNLSSEEKEFQEKQTLAYQLESEEMYKQQMKSVFKCVTIGYNLLVFTIEASKYLINRSFLKNLEKCYSLVSDEYATHFVYYTRLVASLIKDHKDYLNYLGLSSKYDTFEKVHELFQIGIHVSNQQGYTIRTHEFDQNLHMNTPNLKHFSFECKKVFNLRLKTQVEVDEKKLPKSLDQLTLEDIRLEGIKEDINQTQMVDLDQNNIFEDEEQQIKDFFKNRMFSFRNQESKPNQFGQKLSEPLIDEFQSQFVKKMEESRSSKDKPQKEERVQSNQMVWRNQSNQGTKQTSNSTQVTGQRY